jgi:hypothetical protein
MMRAKDVAALMSRHGVRRNIGRNCASRWRRAVGRRSWRRDLHVHLALVELLLVLAVAVWLRLASGLG